jgi:hypothetical protein
MPLRRIAVLAVLLTATACAPEKVVYTDDEVPLTAPLDAGLDSAVGMEQNDPPARVVRLGHVDGSVSRQPAGLDDWAPAPVNLPLASGDNLWVAPGGRAELQAGSTGLRLAPDTGLQVLRLDDRSMQLGLPRGSVAVRIAQGRDLDSVEVDTPDGAVLMARPGNYRVDVDPGAGADRVTVRAGLAEVTAAGVNVPVNPGSTMELAGGDAPHYDVVAAPDPDGFDQWCAARNRREDGSDSAGYLGRDMIGSADLDGQGDWRLDKTYGTVWAPRVAADWAPYRDGRWVWSEPYGWTWVAAEPWGFAPSHYGRWAQSDGGWVWVPHADGMKQARPVYAPALVVFAGGPGLRGGGAAGGGVAWFPLGPREPYLPAYPASRAYVQSLNAASLPPGASALIPTGYANQRVPGALTVVPQNTFLGARPVAGATLTARGAAQGWQLGSAPGLAPRRESLLAPRPGEPSVSRPPEAEVRPLMVRSRLPQAPVPFEARQQALAAGHGRPLALPVLDNLRRQEPPSRGIPARMATTPGPGGILRPVRPMPVAQPVGRPFAPPGAQPGGGRPFAPPGAQPGAGRQQVPPGAGRQQVPPGAGRQQVPPGGQPMANRPAGGPGRQPKGNQRPGQRKLPARRAPARAPERRRQEP